ncbi:MAG: CoA transferase, partial [Acidimicrobiales bacterium]
DLAIIEPMLAALGPQPTVYDRTGLVPLRTGNRTVNNAPRNIYRCADGRYVAVSTSAQSVAERVMTLVGHPEVISEPWFASGHTRAEHTEELDADVGAWVAERTLPEVVEAFEKAQAAVAPVYDIADVMADPQYQALGTIVEVDDDELGRLRMQNVLFRLSATPGAVAWAGRRQGQDNAEVYGSLGLSPGELEELARDGII